MAPSAPKKKAAKDGWELAQYIASDHPLFVQGAPIIKAALELTDEQFATLIS
jgi:hypothetical protein